VEYDAAANLIGCSGNNGTLDQTAQSTGCYDGSAGFSLGRQYDTTSPLGGRLDCVGIWRRKLTSAERTFLYNNGAGRSYAMIAGGGTQVIMM